MLVVNADDLGLSRGVNEGILEAHTNGIVTSASLMVLEPGAGDGAQAAADYDALSIGLHFVDDGSADLDDPDQAARSFQAQLERFRELTGCDPTHVDSHHHVHTWSRARLVAFSRLVEPLGVPLRGQGQVAYVGGFWAQWEPGVTNLRYVSSPFLLHLIRAKVLDGFTELACHPARINGDFSSSYLDERAVELATLTEPGLRAAVEALGVELVSFHSWRRPPC
ncbi:MAG: ChbG/HpnK family deacetylase [Solirubrobacteraceae bacterium]